MEEDCLQLPWKTLESHILFNSCYSLNEQNRFHGILREGEQWPGHIWLTTSGSLSPKWVGLSKKALLTSASAVNEHLESDKQDIWVNALPHFHVGGLSIWARAYLSGATVYDFRNEVSLKWHPLDFYNYLLLKKGTLTSLVPTQLYDLVKLGFLAPSTLRAVIIGGEALLPELYEKAVALQWPILPSYGLTECASQVATVNLGSWKEKKLPSLKLLPHIQCCVENGCLKFKSNSLLTTYAYFEENKIKFFDPKVQGWFISEDVGTLNNNCVEITRRKEDILKVGGERVDLAQLQIQLQKLSLQLGLDSDVTLIALPDERLGQAVHLATNCADKETIAQLVEVFQKSVLPFERLRKIYFLQHLPRSSLGKILKKELMLQVNDAPSIDI